MIKQIIFDFDGTLADSESVFYHVANDVCKKFDLPLFSVEQYQHLASIPIKDAIKELGVKWYQIPQYWLEGCLSFMRHISSISLFDGIAELLNDLDEFGLGLSIISSNSKDNIHSLLEKNDIDYFDSIISVQKLFKKHKFIKSFLKQHHLEPEEVLYVGDEVRDILACKKARIKVIAASWGFDGLSHLIEENPDYIVDSPYQIKDIVEDCLVDEYA
ncbi:MAG: HAD-IA family hydrolase [Eubacteriales bacterium]